MVNLNYNRGRSFEYRYRNELREKFPKAYTTRTAGSHTIGDIIMITQNYTFLIQLKYSKKQPSMREVRKFFRDTERLSAIPHFIWQVPKGDRYRWSLNSEGHLLKRKIKK